jgi:HlyD family secretion protein
METCGAGAPFRSRLNGRRVGGPVALTVAKWLTLFLVLAAAAAGAYFWFTADGNVLRLPGIVEIQEVRLGSKVGGRVAQVLVEEGDIVYPGMDLVVFEAPELMTTRDQLKAKVDAAQAEYDKAVKGPREEEKRAAQAAAAAAKASYEKMLQGWREEEKRQTASDLEAAAAELKQANEDMDRVVELFRAKSIARADYDAALGTRDKARGRFNAVKARFDMVTLGNRPEDKAHAKAEWERAQAQADELNNGTREEDKMLAKARLDEARAKLDEAEVNLKEAVVKVPANLGKAVIEVVAVRPGDLVPAGQPVLRVLRVEDMWVKIFVPETKLDLVPLKKEVEVSIDAPHRILKGRIQQKASSSEFTPRNVQSVEERRYQVFAVKVKVDDPQGVLNAGMAAEVRIPLN